MADQLTDETTQPTLFDVEVPKHVNMAFLYAALKNAQVRIEKLDEELVQVRKDNTWLRNRLREQGALQASKTNAQPDVVTQADLLGTPERKEFFCTVCSQGSGVRTTHSDKDVANVHLAIKREAERNHGKPPKLVQQAS